MKNISDVFGDLFFGKGSRYQGDFLVDASWRCASRLPKWDIVTRAVSGSPRVTGAMEIDATQQDVAEPVIVCESQMSQEIGMTDATDARVGDACPRCADSRLERILQ
eukprot:s2044_g3.t3